MGAEVTQMEMNKKERSGRVTNEFNHNKKKIGGKDMLKDIPHAIYKGEKVYSQKIAGKFTGLSESKIKSKLSSQYYEEGLDYVVIRNNEDKNSFDLNVFKQDNGETTLINGCFTEKGSPMNSKKVITERGMLKLLRDMKGDGIEQLETTTEKSKDDTIKDDALEGFKADVLGIGDIRCCYDEDNFLNLVVCDIGDKAKGYETIRGKSFYDSSARNYAPLCNAIDVVLDEDMRKAHIIIDGKKSKNQLNMIRIDDWKTVERESRFVKEIMTKIRDACNKEFKEVKSSIDNLSVSQRKELVEYIESTL